MVLRVLRQMGLCCFLFCSFFLRADEGNPQQPSVDEQREKLAQILTDDCASMKYTIESLLEDLRMGNVVLANRRHAQEQLQVLHTHLAHIPEQRYVTNNEQLMDLCQEADAIAQALEQGIVRSFDGWQATIAPTRESGLLSTQQMLQKSFLCHARVAKIQRDSMYVGVPWFKRSYRMACDGFSRMHMSHQLLKKCVIAATFFAACWYVYHLPNRSMDGVPLDGNGQIIPLENRTMVVRSLDMLYKLDDNIKPLVGIAPMAGWFLLHSFQRELVQGKNWLMRKLQTIHCHLRGLRPPADMHKTYPTRGFEDVRGNEHNKCEATKLIEFIVDYERFKQKNIPFQRGVLLWGKTRTGKTFFAEKICGEINKRRRIRHLPPCPFIQVDAGKMRELERWGNGLAGYIEWAREEAPCVLFIDELHNLLKDDRKVLTELLTGMSGIFQGAHEKPVLIIAATNQPEVLDAALRQKGRFGIELMFEYPHFIERKSHVADELTKMFLTLDERELAAIAHETDGRSYEDLNELVAYMKQEANIHKKPFSKELLQDGLDHVIRRIQISHHELDARTRHIAAIHHASTIVACARLSPHKVLVKATLLPVQILTDQERMLQQGGIFWYGTSDQGLVHDPHALRAQCQEFLAGHAGEKLLLGSSAYTYTHDVQSALALCKQMSFQGMSTQQVTAKAAHGLLEAALAFKDQCEQDVVQLLDKERVRVQRIAQALEQKISLDASEIAQLLTHQEPN